MVTITSKSHLLKLMVDELCDNIRAREDYHTCEKAYPSYGLVPYLANGQSKTQILNDIRRCRRTLLELYHIVERQA